MSNKDVREVISRLAAYEDFRKLVSCNSRKALEEYDLSLLEQEALKDIASSSFTIDIDSMGNLDLAH